MLFELYRIVVSKKVMTQEESAFLRNLLLANAFCATRVSVTRCAVPIHQAAKKRNSRKNNNHVFQFQFQLELCKIV